MWLPYELEGTLLPSFMEIPFKSSRLAATARVCRAKKQKLLFEDPGVWGMIRKKRTIVTEKIAPRDCPKKDVHKDPTI